MQCFTVDFFTKIYAGTRRIPDITQKNGYPEVESQKKIRGYLSLTFCLLPVQINSSLKTSNSLPHSLSPYCYISTGFLICQLLLAEGCHVPKAGTEFPVINSHSEYISQLTRKQLAQG